MGNEFQSYIDPCNLSGEFICNVESLYYGTKQVSLLLHEKGMIKNYCLSTNATCFKASNINSIISAPFGYKQENGVYSSHKGEL